MKRPHAASITSDSSGQTRYNADKYWGACLFFVRSFGFGLRWKRLTSFGGRCYFWLRVRAFQLACRIIACRSIVVNATIFAQPSFAFVHSEIRNEENRTSA